MRLTFLRTLTALALAAIIITLTLSAGMRHGMHRAMPIAADEQTAIAISLSKSIYHIGFGYVGLKQVADKLHEYWNRGAQGWSDLAKLQDNFRNGDLLNEGIRAATSLGVQVPGYISDGSLITANS